MADFTKTFSYSADNCASHIITMSILNTHVLFSVLCCYSFPPFGAYYHLPCDSHHNKPNSHYYLMFFTSINLESTLESGYLGLESGDVGHDLLNNVNEYYSK